MPKPRSRKPVDIPSLPPVGRGDVRRGAERPVTTAASVVMRAALLVRPRGDHRIAHRRLVGPRADAMRASGEGSHEARVPWNTFRGATARFVAFG